MKPRQIRALARVLREEGISHYRCGPDGVVELVMGGRPQPRPVKAGKGDDGALPEDPMVRGLMATGMGRDEAVDLAARLAQAEA